MQATYDQLGAGYNTSRAADPGIVAQLRSLLHLRTVGDYLDIGCGTGNYTREMARLGGRWHGIDPSEVMLAQARAISSPVSWHRGGVDALPFADRSFDGAICTNVIHHFADLTAAFAEVRRVMRAGRFVIFTGLPEQAANYWLCHYFPEMMRRTAKLMPSEPVVRGALLKAGFVEVDSLPFFVTKELRDLFLYSGKLRPELYLRSDVRANITSFARHCSGKELEDGLTTLASDIDSGAIEAVRRGYDATLADYSFMVATQAEGEK